MYTEQFPGNTMLLWEILVDSPVSLENDTLALQRTDQCNPLGPSPGQLCHLSSGGKSERSPGQSGTGTLFAKCDVKK